MTKKVLLICPAQNYRAKCEMYPSGALVLIGTMLHNLRHDVRIVHMEADRLGLAELTGVVSGFEPDIVGITINTFQTKSAKEISRCIKEVNRKIFVVVGGPHPSALKTKIFNDFPYVDIAVIGEGEHTFIEIVEGKNLEEIKGICHDHKINEPRPLAKNLNYIPLPNLDLVGFNEDKFVGAHPVGARPTMYIMASRGCPFQCTFCNKSVWGNTVRLRKPELIIEEIKWLHEKYGIKEIFFQDDTFNLNREWAEKVFTLIIDNRLNKNIIYKTPFRANERLVDKELLELAKEAGFWLIFYGVESGNQEMLNRMKKGLTIQELKRAFELTHSVGLKTIGSFIIGMPGENRETIKDTFSLLKELKPYVAGCSVTTPFSDTEFEKTVVEKGHLLERNYDHYRYGKCVVRTDELTKEDLEYYALKSAHIAKTTQLRDPEYFKKLIIDCFRNPAKIVRWLKVPVYFLIMKIKIMLRLLLGTGRSCR